MDKREGIKRYFEPLPKWTILLIVVGIVCLPVYGLGVILIGVGTWGILRWRNKPDDVQMDAWLEEDLAVLEGKAIEMGEIGPREQIADPAIVTGPRLWDVTGLWAAYRKGKDDQLRFTPVAVAIFDFTADWIAVYQCILDLATGHALDETAERYAYSDVLSVSSSPKSRIVQIAGKATLQLNAAETFEFTTSRGASVQVLLRDPILCQMMGGGAISTTRSERAIQAIKKMAHERSRRSA